MQRALPRADGGEVAPNCWERQRDHRDNAIAPERFFDETARGAACWSNWYEGNPGDLGQEDKLPTFSANAPALLGFDESIDGYCATHQTGQGRYNGHAGNCINANLNILSLYGER
eukprot:2645849-Prymnesium_polylepis.1